MPEKNQGTGLQWVGPLNQLAPCECACFTHDRLLDPMDCRHQAPLSVRLPRQEYWNGLPCTPPGDLPDPGIKSATPETPTLQVDFILLSHLNWPHTPQETEPPAKLAKMFPWKAVQLHYKNKTKQNNKTKEKQTNKKKQRKKKKKKERNHFKILILHRTCYLSPGMVSKFLLQRP